MRGPHYDRINRALPDELILEIFSHVDAKPSRDACSLVCRRWFDLERLSRDSVRLGASNNPDLLVRLLSLRFPNVKSLHMDERLSVATFTSSSLLGQKSLKAEKLRMRGPHWDRINRALPDELILEMIGHVDSKPSQDVCSLICRRWFDLERLSRDSVKLGASNNPDLLVWLLSLRFPNVKSLHMDERLSVTLFMLSSGRRRGDNTSVLMSLYPHNRHEIVRIPFENYEMESFCLSDSGLTAVGEGFTKMEKLSLIWCSNVTSIGLRSVAEKCTYLRSLDLQGCYIGDQGLTAVGDCCKQLEDLNLRFCEGVSDPGLIELVTKCGKSLKSIGIAACAKITDACFVAVGLHCKALETLSLDSEFINNKGMLAVAKGCRLLKVLKLQCINVTDEALQAVGVFCSSLELLALNSFQKFTDMSLSSIGKGCKRLKNLTLSDCYHLSDTGLEAVAKGCSELSHLEVNGCHSISTRGLEFVGRSCTRLTELSLLYCQKIGNNALTEIGRGCKDLQSLHLVDCTIIGDEALCGIALGCRTLKKLHIWRCYEVGNAGIIAIGENCKFLSDLSIRFCDRVGDEALIAIGQGCPLQHLNVSGCHLIGDVGMTAIARGCSQLTYLDVSVLQNLGDMALAELGEGCPSLKEVVISHCRQLTDVGVSHLVKNCSLLESCHMVYCPGISATGVATVISSCVNIKKVLVEKWKVSQRTKRRAGSIISYLCVDL